MYKIIIVVATLLTLYGCVSVQSYREYYANVESYLLAEEYDYAIEHVAESKNTFYRERDRVLYYLDLGLLYHYNGQYTKSNEYLTRAEYAIEELYTKSVSRAAASLLLNDTVLEYRGEDYEDIYINIFKALNFLHLNDFDAAFVEIRRINDKLNVLSDNYAQLASEYNRADESKLDIKPEEIRFHNSALGRYLSMLIYRAEGRLDAANIDFQKIREAFVSQSHLYDFGKPSLSNSLRRSSQAKLNIVGFVGRAPDKRARTLYIHTERNTVLIASTEQTPRSRHDRSVINVFRWPNMESGYHFKFQLPYMVKRSTEVSRARVFVNDRYVASLDKMESIENIAVEMFEARKSIIYMKTIIRAIAKGLLAREGKKEITKEVDNPIADFLIRRAVDAAVDATEQADLRISRLFPAKALVGEVDLRPGVYDIRVEYYNRRGRMLYADEFPNTRVRRNQLNLLSTYFLR